EDIVLYGELHVLRAHAGNLRHDADGVIFLENVHRWHPGSRGAVARLPVYAEQAVVQQPAEPAAQADEVGQRGVSGDAWNERHISLPPVSIGCGFGPGWAESRSDATQPACPLREASFCHNDNSETATVASRARFAGVIFAHTVTHTTSVALPPADVLERAKRFFAERVPQAAAYVEKEGPQFVVLRGQEGEEGVIRAWADDGGGGRRGGGPSPGSFDRAAGRFFWRLRVEREGGGGGAGALSVAPGG